MPGPYYHYKDIRNIPSVKDEDDEDPLSTQAQPPTLSNFERPPGCINHNPTPAFSVLCSVMDRMRSEESGKRKDTLSRFMNLWRIKVGNDLFPLIRLLLPDRDRERPVYNLKEAMLAKCYIEVLGLDKHSEAAHRLIKWKQPVEGQGDALSGDFARVCYHEIAARSTVEEGTLTIEAVNDLLDELARGRLKQADYVPIMRRINQKCTPTEQEWIIRIILKDLRISIREKGVFSCFHPDAASLFNVCSDLKRVCWTLYDPGIKLEKNQTNIELFRCFLPQLCYRSPTSSHEAISKLVGGPISEFIMEEKLDGERIQLHMRGSGAQWFYCSRKAKDYTYLYGAHVGEGSLTQFIAGIFQDDVRNNLSIILDGEMMVWDPSLEKYLAFGTLKTAASDKVNDENAPRPCFKVFDILLLNDRCLTGVRLSERKRLLRSGRVFKDIGGFCGRLEFVQERMGRTGKDILSMLENVLETKGEGLVVKNPHSLYQTNFRGPDWVKVKPEYADQMGENFDLLVLGGWWGKGGRTGKISSLLCGLRVPQEEDGSDEIPEFTTFASVGSGMSHEDYEWIMSKHRGHWKPFDRHNPPSWMKLGSVGLDDKPDVYIEPDKSFVMEVKASEIVPAASGYGCGYTLRFPRCRFLHRDRVNRESLDDEIQDRDMWNCLSLEEFTALLQTPKKRYVDDETGTTSKRKKRKVQPKRKTQVIESVRGQKIQGLPDHGIFSGLQFYIPKDVPGYKKAEMEAIVRKFGGDFTQAQLADRSAIVISHDDKTPRVKAQIRHGVSIVKPQWIFESIERRQPLPFLKDFLVFAADDTKTGSFYDMSLKEFEKLSNIHEEPGSVKASETEEDEAQESDGIEKRDDVASLESMVNQNHSSQSNVRSSDQKCIEEEWGLHDVDPPSQTRLRYSSEENVDTDDNQSFSDLSEDAEKVNEDGLVYEARGESTLASAYDLENIFHGLCFYMDTPENAKNNNLLASQQTSERDDVRKRMDEAESLVKENGGLIVNDIKDHKLTHIVMDDHDSGHYAELMHKTARPKLKHIVLPSWVTESVNEETLMNEDAYKPR